MEWHEVLGGTLNIGILAIFYTVFGALISYLLFHLFDDFGKEWKEQDVLYQTADVVTELTLVGAIAFWSMSFIRDAAPMFPVNKVLDKEVDTYISGLFFAFAMFMFLGDLTEKIKYIYEKFLKTGFVRFFPENWSIMKMVFGSRKMENKKSTE
jgi:ABC-type Na+ efflux pump permease subunit